MVSGISLANKSQLLVGLAVVVILVAALSVPWIRTRTLVEESQREVARQLAEAWIEDRVQMGMLTGAMTSSIPPTDIFNDPDAQPVLRMSLVSAGQVFADDEETSFFNDALQRFRDDPERTEYFVVDDSYDFRAYRYARVLRASDLRSLRDQMIMDFSIRPFEPDVANPIRAILLIDRTSQFAEGQLLLSRVFILSAGVVGSLLAVLVFYFILTKLILSPVRELRETTERVQAGDLAARSTIRTGDEFEQLSEAFNVMLDQVSETQAKLRSINESLDLKVSELAEANVGLFESNRLKSEFLANVSHELRTPLNAIIGFAELLDELARSDVQADPKRQRYISNILNSGRSLLEMINELLDMAKIEAGRMEVTPEQTSIVDLIEGIAGIMRPQAEAKRIELSMHVADNVPVVETDPGKLQQILYNFLSNAIKFTPPDGRVSVNAERIRRQDNSLGVRISVTDTGPGISEDMQDVIFEKFRQLDASHTRQQGGTGLGLAICRELAEMLDASVSFTSSPGGGSTFFVDVPTVMQTEPPQPLMA